MGKKSTGSNNGHGKKSDSQGGQTAVTAAMDGDGTEKNKTDGRRRRAPAKDETAGKHVNGRLEGANKTTATNKALSGGSANGGTTDTDKPTEVVYSDPEPKVEAEVVPLAWGSGKSFADLLK